MDRIMVDRLVPLVYAALILAAVFFFSSALAGIAIFGGLVMAAYYSGVRPRLIAAERAKEQNAGDGSLEPRE